MGPNPRRTAKSGCATPKNCSVLIVPRLEWNPRHSVKLRMADPSLLRDALSRTADLWANGHHSEALKLLDECIATAVRENESLWIRPLCMQAAFVAESMGDLRLVRQYSEQILSHGIETGVERALALYTLADALPRETSCSRVLCLSFASEQSRRAWPAGGSHQEVAANRRLAELDRAALAFRNSSIAPLKPDGFRMRR
jgi:hypothetical protein